MTTSTKVIGIGNILRRDDGIGVYVIEELKKAPLPEDVELIDAGTRSLDIVSFLEGAERVVIVDAVRGCGRAGEIYRADIDTAGRSSLPSVPVLSLHEFGLEEMLELAREVWRDRFPEKITFLGVEVDCVEPGLGLTPALGPSVAKVVGLIRKELADIQNGRTACPGEAGADETAFPDGRQVGT